MALVYKQQYLMVIVAVRLFYRLRTFAYGLIIFNRLRCGNFLSAFGTIYFA